MWRMKSFSESSSFESYCGLFFVMKLGIKISNEHISFEYLSIFQWRAKQINIKPTLWTLNQNVTWKISIKPNLSFDIYVVDYSNRFHAFQNLPRNDDRCTFLTMWNVQ